MPKALARAGIAALKVGSTCEAADAAARKVIEDAGLGEAFRHRLGHGIGMDVHEPPFLTRGKLGVHSEHLGHLLTEMQYLQRTYPGGTW